MRGSHTNTRLQPVPRKSYGERDGNGIGADGLRAIRPRLTEASRQLRSSGATVWSPVTISRRLRNCPPCAESRHTRDPTQLFD